MEMTDTMEKPSGEQLRAKIESVVAQHESWRRTCLNLCAAENAMSPAVRRLLNTDLAQRYGDYTGRDLAARKYFGTREVVRLEKLIHQLACEVFRARYAELRPLSGHVAGSAVIMAFCRPGDLVLELGRESGGHRLAAKLATSKLAPLQVAWLPFDALAFNVDVARTLDLVRQRHPRLIILGASNFLFPSPVRELADGLRDFPDTLLAYDASHVLGLIAGGRFQDPLAEGAHLALGGTQKSLPGPQGGLIISDSQELMETLGSTVYPALISNHHLARLPALAVALAEMQEWGAAYADQVIRNARALGAALVKQDVPVVAAERGCTASHTVLLATAPLGPAQVLGRRLESAHIISTAIRLPSELGSDGLRLGVQEITRRGADEPLIDEIARAIADVLLERRDLAKSRAHVADLVQALQDIRFVLPSA
jgi:glycine hydroxymethyltransferase